MNSKVFILGLLFCCPIGQVVAFAYGYSYFGIRPLFEVTRPERTTTFREFRDMREDGYGASFEGVVFGGFTTNGYKIAQYFLPNESDEITVGEDASNAMIGHYIDMNAYNAGILTAPASLTNADGNVLTFQSKVRFCPKQRAFGVGFAYYQRLPGRFWLDASFPVVRVENRLNMCEKIINSGAGQTPDGAFSDFISAMGDCNTARKYGRMVNKCLQRTGVPQIDVRLGYNTHHGSKCNYGWFVGLILPTGKKPECKYLFEPILGNNGFFGFSIGSYGTHRFFHDENDRSLSFEYESMLRYLLSNQQKRSFDLKGKPWSRYMVVYKNSGGLPDWHAEEAVVGESIYLDYLINHSTLCVNVQPHFTVDINMALRYQEGGFSAQAGGNLFVRHVEDINFCRAGCPTVGVAALRSWMEEGESGTPNAYTRSLATVNTPVFDIQNVPAGNPDIQIGQTNTKTYRAITLDDLDKESGACPAMISQIMFCALSYEWLKREHPLFVDFGGSYEWGHENTVANRWLAWAKFGIAI